MKQIISGLLGTIACPKCGNTTFEVPDGGARSEAIITCSCSHALGSYSALEGLLRNHPHGGVSANIVRKPPP